MIPNLVEVDNITETVTKGTTPTSIGYNFSPKGIPFLRVNNIKEGLLDTKDVLFIDTETNKALARSVIQPNDVLLSIAGTIGRSTVVPPNSPVMNCNQAVAIIRLSKKVDPQYFCLWLNSDSAFRQITGSKVTGTISNLSLGCIKKLKIPLPPLEEQKRIAAILDKADAIRRKRKEAIRLTEELLRSTFLDMFGNPVTNPEEWDKCKLSELGCVVTGNTPPRATPENYGDDIEWIKSDNITTPYHFLTYATEGLSSQGKKIARIVPSNSILVACIAGSRSSIGRAALADREVAFNQQINAIVPNPNVDPYFLYTQFFVAQHLVQAQSTDSMKGLVSKSKFSNIEFIRPLEQKQREFGKWFLKFHTWSSSLRDGEQYTDNLFNSLLQKAFRGEL